MVKRRAVSRPLAPRFSTPDRLDVTLRTREPAPQRDEPSGRLLLRRNRAQVKEACVLCRRGKAKVCRAVQAKTCIVLLILQSADSQQCDGQRSSCQHCIEKDLTCVYDIEPGMSHLASLRRKHNALQSEVNQLHGVIEYIRARPDMDASETFRQIRASNEPLDIAKSWSTTSAL